MRIMKLLPIMALAVLPVAAAAQTPQASSTDASQAAAPSTAAQMPPTGAQAPASAQTAPSDAVGAITSGDLDMGIRGSSLTGDPAKFENYRDLGNGLFFDRARFHSEQNGWYVDLGGNHIGRTDQSFNALVNKAGTFKGYATWNQTPTLMSDTTASIYQQVSPGVFRIDDSIQTALQKKTTTINAVVANAAPFDLQSHRWVGDAGLQYLANPNTTFKFDVQRTIRQGSQPYGATFGFSNDIELAAPIDQQTTDVNASGEYNRGRGLFRVSYQGSYFHNDVTSMVWDNPYVATDTSSAPSQGRESLAPSNYMNTVSGLASFRLPGRSRVSGYLSFGQLKDSSDTTLIPMTINTAIAPVALPRSTVDGDVRETAADVSFTSRPNNLMNLDVRYRFNNMDNRTPIFTVGSTVQYDASASAGPFQTEPYSLKRNDLDANVHFTPGKYVNVGAGYQRNQGDYNFRLYSTTVDQTANLTLDVIGNQWFTLRTHYDHAQRRGSGMDPDVFLEISEQPDLRQYDIANRDEDKVLLTAIITPASTFSINLSGGKGKDNYPDAGFGLENSHNGYYSLGFDATPTDRVTFGLEYELEDAKGLQESRSANPGAQFVDPTRDWFDNSHDWTHSVDANADISKIGDKMELKFNYDLSRAKSTYFYSVPSDTTLYAAGAGPVQLPPVFNQLQRGTVDAIYSVTERLSLGLSYWYERYQVNDFAMDGQALPTLNIGTSTLLLGYTYLPYTANLVWGRIMYHW